MKQGRPALHAGENTGIRLYKMHTHSSKFVCFDCRVCFHKWSSWRSDLDKLHACLNCKKDMLYAGSAFRAPPRRDVKEWAKLEVYIRAGNRFHYYGMNGIIAPLTKSEVELKVKWKKRRVLPNQNDIARTPYISRGPGAGKRVRVKHWNAPHVYRPEQE
ncbi:hypothetical protein [Acinetobacter sp.]|uniref:hypothetical protein n=1 Tax=Acinetobacter sp. TaxID=472 RepID=UPI00388F1A26